MPDGRCVVICRECDAIEDYPVVMPFSSYLERAKWAAGHAAGAGHTRTLSFDGWPTLAEAAVLVVEHDEDVRRLRELNRRVRGGRAVSDDMDLTEAERLLRAHADDTVPVPAVIRKPWPRNPRYLIGDDGTVLGPSGRILCTQVGTHGYLQISINGADGDPRARAHPVHRMVCETFHGPRLVGMQAAHGDGNPHNNRATNLRWATVSENVHDSIRHGTFARGPRQRGEGHHLAKLTPEKVRAIRAEYAAGGWSFARLGKKYGVATGSIAQVVDRISWKHIE